MFPSLLKSIYAFRIQCYCDSACISQVTNGHAANENASCSSDKTTNELNKSTETNNCPVPSLLLSVLFNLIQDICYSLQFNF